MRFRLILLIGLAIGYVLGAKAGRERYDQIRKLWQQAMGSEPAQQFSSQARDIADTAVSTIEHKTTDGMNKVNEKIAARDTAGGGGT